jgi:oligoendopeptidase F
MTDLSYMDWDLTSYFPSFDGEEMRRFKEGLKTDIARLRARAGGLAGLDADNGADWEAVVLACEDLLARHRHLYSYIGCLTAADARNEAFSREEGALDVLSAEMSKVSVELLRAFKTAPDEVFQAFIRRPALADAGHYLTRLRIQAGYTMSPEEERLAADLGVNGIAAWGRLYDTVSGKLEFDVVYPDGRTERLPMSRRRSLLDHPDRRIRKAAFEGGNAAWASVESVAAAALNAIAGTRLTLNRRRGVDHFLDVALFQAAISRKTLDAMFEAIFSEIEVGRRILRYKARLMGTKGVAWYDLGADLDLPDQKPVGWEAGQRLVKDAFTQSYPALGAYVQSTYEKRWIDWSPRPGKRPGAFCTGSPLINETRVYMTHNNTMGDVLTLAHELGHAFHGYALRQARPLARSYPMTLAESASTFGEMLLVKGLLDSPDTDDATRAFLLNLEASHAVIYLLDIPVRYEFEKALYEERASGEAGVSRLKDLMIEAQRRVLGDTLEPGGEDPWFWASKLHFYITGVTFYNFPYTFGFLLSRGLFALFLQEGPDFLPRYEAFLRRSGSDTAENVVKHTLGRDLEKPDFWVEAIRSLEAVQDRLEAVLPGVLPGTP